MHEGSDFLKFEELIHEFENRNNVEHTFYNKFVNAYTYLYTYFYMGIKKNMSFIVMEKDGKVDCISKLSMFNQRKFESIKNVEELDKIFDMFLNKAMRNESLILEEAV